MTDGVCHSEGKSPSLRLDRLFFPPSHLSLCLIALWLKFNQEASMNEQQIGKVINLNLAFWAVAIAFP